MSSACVTRKRLALLLFLAACGLVAATGAHSPPATNDDDFLHFGTAADASSCGSAASLAGVTSVGCHHAHARSSDVTTPAGEPMESGECGPHIDASQHTQGELVELVRRAAVSERCVARVDARSLGASLARFLLAAAVPVLVQTDAVARWPARAWTLESLEAAMPPRLDGVYTHDEPVFVYFNMDKPLASARRLAPAARAPFSVRNGVPRAALWTGLRSNGTGALGFVYLSGRVETVAGPTLARAMAPIDELAVCEGDAVQQQNMWLGAEQVTAHTHYDAFHNSFVQLLGRKTFELDSPDLLWSARLFPRLHPSYRQSQCLGARGGRHLPELAALCPEFARAAPLRVTLEPGDMLYLPPFWLHRVVAASVSVSSNLWCDSWPFAAMERAFSLPVPIELAWGFRGLRHLWTALARRLALASPDAAAGDNARGGAAFARRLYESRYGLLFPESTLDAPPSAWACGAEPILSAAEQAALVPALEPHAFDAKVRALAAAFSDVQMSAAVRELHVAHWLEELVLALVGIELVPEALVCLARV